MTAGTYSGNRPVVVSAPGREDQDELSGSVHPDLTLIFPDQMPLN